MRLTQDLHFTSYSNEVMEKNDTKIQKTNHFFAIYVKRVSVGDRTWDLSFPDHSAILLPVSIIRTVLSLYNICYIWAFNVQFNWLEMNSTTQFFTRRDPATLDPGESFRNFDFMKHMQNRSNKVCFGHSHYELTIASMFRGVQGCSPSPHI